MLLLNFTVWQHAWPMGLWLSQFVALGIHAVLHLGMIVAMLLPGPTTECMLARKVISAVVKRLCGCYVSIQGACLRQLCLIVASGVAAHAAALSNRVTMVLLPCTAESAWFNGDGVGVGVEAMVLHMCEQRKSLRV
jgi:hypothetical protein